MVKYHERTTKEERGMREDREVKEDANKAGGEKIWISASCVINARASTVWK